MWIVATIDTLALSFVHVALAACVTAHVLLTKRNVGSSIAWIGLAWLSPIVGSILYVLLGINRVKARAICLREKRPKRGAVRPSFATTITDDHLSPLELTVGRITGRQADEGNNVALFHNGDEAYPRMIAAIEAARTSIALSTFILRLDQVGRTFVDALTRAHRRGVEVRVIVDGIGSGYIISPAYRRLQQSGVPVARFLHSLLPWRMPFLNLRTHKKLLSVDGLMAFTGGLNIGDENRVRENPPNPVRDTHFLFEGPVVAQLNDVFAEDWLFVSGEELEGEAWFPAIDEAGTAIARAIASGPDQDIEKIESVILQAIACARQSINVVTPYFLSDDLLATSLALAAMRGIEVDIIVPEKNNHLIMGWATRARIGHLVEAGCRVWSNPPPFDHSKIMTVDGIWGLIGSANWDMRSFRLNFELDVEIYHSDLVQRIDGSLAAKQGRRLTLAELRSRPLPVRLRDNAARLLLPYL
jgi:cardiolipin synthase